MRNAMLIAAVLCVISASFPARSADLAYRASPPPRGPDYASPVYDWNAFYIGGHLGGAFSGNNNFDSAIIRNISQGRFLGGLQAGADYQFAPNWLVGIEGQYSWVDGHLGADFPEPGNYTYSNRQSGLGSLTGRLGYVWGPGMVYAKGGYAFASNKDGVTDAGVPVAFTSSGDHSNGFTVGTGLEFLVAPNWSAKIEYQYFSFGRTILQTPELGKFSTDDNTVKLGINYRFNSALWH
ncbi:MAG: outer membrane beta-barrel protein [Alphaproteobacteria bacterium]|nr:outer membrane beta-barrel protein [Alphaproteobacteria bacterium]